MTKKLLNKIADNENRKILYNEKSYLTLLHPLKAHMSSDPSLIVRLDKGYQWVLKWCSSLLIFNLTY